MKHSEFILKQKINGIEVPITITIEVEQDFDTDIKDDFDNGTEAEIEAYRRRFQDGGDLFIAVVLVRAEAFGTVGTDILGSCHMHCNNMFDSKPFDDDLKDIVESHGMIENAIDELTEAIIERANMLNRFSNKGGAE